MDLPHEARERSVAAEEERGFDVNETALRDHRELRLIIYGDEHSTHEGPRRGISVGPEGVTVREEAGSSTVRVHVLLTKTDAFPRQNDTPLTPRLFLNVTPPLDPGPYNVRACFQIASQGGINGTVLENNRTYAEKDVSV